MTLLIASRDGPSVWMVADSAVTGGNIGARQQEYALKIVPSTDGRALVGFAGDEYHGIRLINNAALLPAGNEAIRFLLNGQHQCRSVEFAYAYVAEGDPHLVRIKDGREEELPAFHLGVCEAFEQFQRIRHDVEIDYTPEAIKQLIAGSRCAEGVPDKIFIAIESMLRLFAERPEKDIGGWVTPYHLTRDGAFLCSYGYAVSDPILSKIGPGSIIPHGTAEAGGFGLSLTELGVLQGVVVYWLQRPGGTVFLKAANGYEARDFEGTPIEFVEKASEDVGQRVVVFFGEQPPHGPPESITIMRDDSGTPSMAIAKHGHSFSSSVLNVARPFRSDGVVKFSDHSEASGSVFATNPLRITLSDDKSTATVGLMVEGQPTAKVVMNARDLDLAIAVLGEARALLRDAVPPEPRKDKGTREVMVLDPAWRTQMPMHPSLNGLELRLRHPGLGWLTFVIPWHEAKSLGEWLSKNSTAPNPASGQ